MNNANNKIEAYIPSIELWLPAEKIPCRHGRNNVPYVYAVTKNMNESFWGPEHTFLTRQARNPIN